MFYIVIREQRSNDIPIISEVVRNAYISNVYNSWLNALFNEVTFQIIVLLSAIMFICFGVPLLYCVFAIPLTLIMLYVIIYGSVLMKSAEVMYSKRALQGWVAEAYEPYFFTKNPKSCWYKILNENDLEMEGVKVDEFNKKVIATVAVMKHNATDDWAWLYRLAVNQKYRRKGIGLKLVETVKEWCRNNHFNNIELAMSECQEGARELFNDAGFEVKQLYHKKLFTSAVNLQMFQLRCEIRSTF